MARYSVRRGNPYGVDYHTPDPIAKGVWDCMFTIVRSSEVILSPVSFLLGVL
jgi:hypothetical protein